MPIPGAIGAGYAEVEHGSLGVFWFPPRSRQFETFLNDMATGKPA
jgi:hypothetical protein